MRYKIDEYRKRINMTIKELASRIDVTEDFLWKVNAGTRNPSMPTLERIAKELGTKPHLLMERRDDWKHRKPAMQSHWERYQKVLDENKDLKKQIDRLKETMEEKSNARNES